ncbi:MAG: hypothetical protein K2M87_01370 [Muribaculaceae bacterium]|nr:hypothetical protein [Muribaculaceae bacterium]
MEAARSFRKIFPTVGNLILDTLLLGKYEKIKIRKDLVFNTTGRECKVAYIIGADLMCRMADIKQYGAFNPGFFMYYEEIELCHRITRAGYSIMNVPGAKIQHLEGKSGVIGERHATIHYNSADTYRKLTLTPVKYRLYRRILPLIIMSRIFLGKLSGRKNTVTFWETWKKLYDKSPETTDTNS